MNDRSSPCGIILAGGRSQRMGRNKALAEIGGETLLARTIRKLSPQVSSLSINALPGWAEDFSLPIVPDTFADHAGPLAGVLAGLKDAQDRFSAASHLASVPADSPFFPDDLVARLASSLTGADEIAIAVSGGQIHPVFGLWPMAITEDLEHWLRDPENRRLRSFLARHRVIEVPFEAMQTRYGLLDPFYNINTPEELAQAERFLQGMTS